MTTYLKAIQKPGNPENCAHMSRDQIVAAIEQIGEDLRRPMSDTERALLVLDRKDLRARLAQIEAA